MDAESNHVSESPIPDSPETPSFTGSAGSLFLIEACPRGSYVNTGGFIWPHKVRAAD